MDKTLANMPAGRRYVLAFFASVLVLVVGFALYIIVFPDPVSAAPYKKAGVVLHTTAMGMKIFVSIAFMALLWCAGALIFASRFWFLQIPFWLVDFRKPDPFQVPFGDVVEVPDLKK